MPIYLLLAELNQASYTQCRWWRGNRREEVGMAVAVASATAARGDFRVPEGLGYKCWEA